MAANAINITINLQTGAATSAAQQFNVQIKNLGNTVQNSSKQAAGGFDQISQAINGLTSSLASLAAVHLAASMVEAADSINRVYIALETMTGSAVVATRTLEQVRHITKEQPFALTEMNEMTQRLVAFGFEAKKVPAMVEAIGNAAAALGKGKAGIDSITLALGQMQAKGIVQGQELFRQLAEQGVNGGKYLKAALEKELGRGLNMTEFRRMIEKGIIASEPAIAIIMAGMKKEFGDAGQKMASLVSVRFTKVQDELRELARIIIDKLGPALLQMLNYVQDLVEWLQKLDPWVWKVAGAVVFLTTMVIALTAAFKALALLGAAEAILKIGAAVTTITTALQLAVQARSVTAFFGLMAQEAGLAMAALTPVALLVGQIVLAMGAFTIGYKIGEKIRGALPDWMVPGKADERAAEEAQKTAYDNKLKFAHKLRDELAKLDQAENDKAAAEEARKTGKKVEAVKSVYSKAPVISYESMSPRDLDAEVKRLQDAYTATKALADKNRQSLIIANNEALKHQMEIAQQTLDRALAKTEGPIFGLVHRYNSIFKEVWGNAAAVALVQKAVALDMQREVEKFNKSNREVLEKEVETERKVWEKQLAYHAKILQDTLKYQEETDKLAKETLDSIAEFNVTTAERVNAEKLEQLDSGKRQTLAQEIEYLQKSAEIQLESAKLVFDAKIDLEEQRFRFAMNNLEAERTVQLLQAKSWIEVGEILKRTGERAQVLVDESAERRRQLVVNNEFDIAKIRLTANKATNNAIIDEQKKIYEKLKSSLDKVFDALLDKSTSVWQAMGNALKTAVIGAIKEIVTSRAAASLMQLFGYGNVNFGGGMRGLGGQQPTFGGGMTGATGRMGGIGRFLFPGAGVATAAVGSGGGMTPGQAAMRAVEGPFPQGVSTYGQYSGGFSSAAGGAGNLAPVATPAFGVMKSLLPAAAVLGGGYLASQGIQQGGKVGVAKTGIGAGIAGAGAASLTGGLGMGLSMAGGGLLGAGVGLAGYGLYRGGKAGIGLTAAGGAMIGAVLGTALFPGIGTLLGAGIGAAVGGIAGLFRSLVKTADQKLQEKIRALYAIDVQDKGVRAQILEMAKSKYGGNIDMAIRAPETQELIKLYAMSTGQSATGMPRQMYGATLNQSGAGGLQLQPVYSNGQVVESPYSGVTTSQWSQGMYVQLNPQQANDLFEGRVVNVIGNNPDSVGQAAATSSRSGSSRDAQRTALIEPLTVVR